jgi:hypothetical protein
LPSFTIEFLGAEMDQDVRTPMHKDRQSAVQALTLLPYGLALEAIPDAHVALTTDDPTIQDQIIVILHDLPANPLPNSPDHLIQRPPNLSALCLSLLLTPSSASTKVTMRVALTKWTKPAIPPIPSSLGIHDDRSRMRTRSRCTWNTISAAALAVSYQLRQIHGGVSS